MLYVILALCAVLLVAGVLSHFHLAKAVSSEFATLHARLDYIEAAIVVDARKSVVAAKKFPKVAVHRMKEI